MKPIFTLLFLWLGAQVFGAPVDEQTARKAAFDFINRQQQQGKRAAMVGLNVQALTTT